MRKKPTVKITPTDILSRLRKRADRANKEAFVRNLKKGKPKKDDPGPSLVARVPRQFDGGGLDD